MAMRKILFRGRPIDEKEWVYGFFGKNSFGKWPLKASITPVEDAEAGYLHPVEVLPETVGQFTGLTDKNGKKIFEGDIIETTRKFKHGYKRYEVYFNNFLCHFALKPPDYWWTKDGQYDALTLSGAKSKHMVVIGNIHDNPELLGGGASDLQVDSCLP